jgi:hypothetical protein
MNADLMPLPGTCPVLAAAPYRVAADPRDAEFSREPEVFPEQLGIHGAGPTDGG